MKKYRVLIADDEAIVRKSIIKMIEWDALSLELAGECANGEEAVRLSEQYGKADILLTDTLMPVMDGIALAGWMHENCPECDVIFFSGHSEYHLLRDAMRNHAADYLLKPVDRGDLNRVLRSVLRKKKGLSAEKKLLLGYVQGQLPFDRCMEVIKLPAVVVLADCIKYEAEELQRQFADIWYVSAPVADTPGYPRLLLALAAEENAERLRKRAEERTSDGSIRFQMGLSQPAETFQQLPAAYFQAKKALMDLRNEKRSFSVYTDDYQSAAIVTVLDYIEHNYQKPIMLQDIARRFHYHADYISRIFKRHTGISFTRYLTRLRVQKAREILRQSPGCRVDELGEAVGIPDTDYFCKVFKKECGCTPQQYRKTQELSEP